MFCINSPSEPTGKGTKQRKNSGSAIVLLALGVLAAVFTIGILGLDISHNCNARTALQNATDAAALAGAATIVTESINPTNFQTWNYPNLTYTVSTDDVKGSAKTRAGTNIADGHNVSFNAGVVIDPKYTPNNSAVGNGVPGNNGSCLVTGNMTIQNLFAGIIGHPKDPVTTVSTATAYVTLAGMNPNVTFPIAVSLDTINGHDGINGNQPLNGSQIGSSITFNLEDPCANATWTSYNNPDIKGKTGSQLNTNAVNYMNSALASVTGSSYNPGTVPSQIVGETSSTGGTQLTSGIDVWGAASGTGTANLAKAMAGSTIILPIIGGDLPFWNQDDNFNGSMFAAGGRQTRPLLGFCAVKVTTATWDSGNNCLKSFTGTLVKALVKGTPGVVNPVVNPGTALNNTNVMALDNLSPGMVQLGLTNSNQQPPKTQLPLNSWYQGVSPAGNNTVSESDGAEETIQPINPNFLTFMATDMDNLCGGVAFNEGINYSTPPNVTGAIQVKQSADPAIHPYDQILVDPKKTLTITSTYSDEVGLNVGNDINGDWSLGAKDAGNAPSFEVLDKDLNVVKPWAYITVGAGNGGSWPFTMNIDPNQIGTGEHLVVIHAFDTDLGHGGINQANGGEAGAPGTPPTDIRGSLWHSLHGANVWDGDAAFYYLDIQYPTCSNAN